MDFLNSWFYSHGFRAGCMFRCDVDHTVVYFLFFCLGIRKHHLHVFFVCVFVSDILLF